MKLLFDENLSHGLPITLRDVYPDSIHVKEVGLMRVSDTRIWAYAKEHSLIIVTKDADFADRCLRDKNATQVIWLRLGNGSTKRIADLMRVRFARITSFVQSEEKCLELNDRPFLVKR